MAHYIPPQRGSSPMEESPSARRKRPEPIVERWEEWGRENGAPPLFFEQRREAEAFLAWLRARRGYSPASLQKYMIIFRQLCLALARRGLTPRQLDVQTYLELRAQLRDAKLPAVVKLYAKYMLAVTGDERWGRLLSQVRVPAGKPRLPEVLTREQVRRLIEECGRLSFELRVLVELLYETGARVGEVLGVRARDVTFDEVGARVLIRSSKSEVRAVRVVLYAADLARLVEGRRPEDRLFERDYNTYLRWLARAWRAAGLPETGRKFHALRHTRATELYGRMSEKAMMLWFGWRTRGMIDVYARVTQEEAEREYLAAVGAARRQEEQPAARCPRCGYPNPGAASYCLRCGAPLKPELQLEKARDTLILTELLRKVEELERRLARKAEKP